MNILQITVIHVFYCIGTVFLCNVLVRYIEYI